MVFALETYCPAPDGRSAARIEEEVIVTADRPAGPHPLPRRRAPRRRQDLRPRRRLRRRASSSSGNGVARSSSPAPRRDAAPRPGDAMAERTLIKGGTVDHGRPGARRPPAGRRAGRGRRDRRGRRRDLDAERRRGDRRDRLPRPAGPRRHAPPHLAGALPEHRLRLDARALLHRPARDDERALPPGGHLRRQPDRHARGARLGHHDAPRLVAQPEHAASTPTPRSTRSSSRARASSSRHGGGIRHWQPSARCRTRPTTCAGSARGACPRTTRSSRCAWRRAATSSRRWRSPQADWALADELGLRISCHFGDGEWGRNRPIAQLARARAARPDDDVRALQHARRRRAADDGRRTACTRLDLAGHRAADGPRLARDRAAARRRHPAEPLDRRLLLERRPPVRDDARDDRHRARLRQRARARRAARPRSTEIELTCRDVLEFATIEGARACGLDGKIGSLTPGKRADVILVRADTFGMTPLNNPIGAVRLQRPPGPRRHDPRRRQGREARRQAARRRRGARAAAGDRVARRHPAPRRRQARRADRRRLDPDRPTRPVEV